MNAKDINYGFLITGFHNEDDKCFLDICHITKNLWLCDITLVDDQKVSAEFFEESMNEIMQIAEYENYPVFFDPSGFPEYIRNLVSTVFPEVRILN